jgi:hypothetical protein
MQKIVIAPDAAFLPAPGRKINYNKFCIESNAKNGKFLGVTGYLVKKNMLVDMPVSHHM